MSELALMLLASQLITNSNPSAEVQYGALDESDKAKVEQYIAEKDQLPEEIEQLMRQTQSEPSGTSKRPDSSSVESCR